VDGYQSFFNKQRLTLVGFGTIGGHEKACPTYGKNRVSGKYFSENHTIGK